MIVMQQICVAAPNISYPFVPSRHINDISRKETTKTKNGGLDSAHPPCHFIWLARACKDHHLLITRTFLQIRSKSVNMTAGSCWRWHQNSNKWCEEQPGDCWAAALQKQGAFDVKNSNFYNKNEHFHKGHKFLISVKFQILGQKVATMQNAALWSICDLK